MARRAVMYAYPPCYLWGTIFIDRNDITRSKDTLGKEVKTIQVDSKKVIFFPEGTRNESETLLPFKKGAFHIAIQSQSSIQPIVVSKYLFLNSKKKIFGRGL